MATRFQDPATIPGYRFLRGPENEPPSNYGTSCQNHSIMTVVAIMWLVWWLGLRKTPYIFHTSSVVSNQLIQLLNVSFIEPNIPSIVCFNNRKLLIHVLLAVFDSFVK